MHLQIPRILNFPLNCPLHSYSALYLRRFRCYSVPEVHLQSCSNAQGSPTPLTPVPETFAIAEAGAKAVVFVFVLA